MLILGKSQREKKAVEAVVRSNAGRQAEEKANGSGRRPVHRFAYPEKAHRDRFLGQFVDDFGAHCFCFNPLKHLNRQ